MCRLCTSVPYDDNDDDERAKFGEFKKATTFAHFDCTYLQ